MSEFGTKPRFACGKPDEVGRLTERLADLADRFRQFARGVRGRLHVDGGPVRAAHRAAGALRGLARGSGEAGGGAAAAAEALRKMPYVSPIRAM
jgi:hypothetical protein